MTDLLPLIVERLNATSGQGRRVTAAELQDYLSVLLGWLPDFSVPVRGSGGAASVSLSAGQALGRTMGGALQGLGATELDGILDLAARFAGTAPVVHTHEFISAITDIDWSTLDEGTTLSRVGGSFVWRQLPTGGVGLASSSGNVFNPLRSNLNLGGFRIVDGGAELIRFSGGVLFICGRPFPKFDLDDPSPGDVWIGGPGGLWVHRPPTGDDIQIGIPGLGGNLATSLDVILELIAQRSLIGHSHVISDVKGETPGKLIAVGPGPGFELIEVDPPVAGPGGVLTNPLGQDLDLGGNRVIDGVRELIRFSNNVLYIGGRPVIPSVITEVSDGQVAIYDEGEEAFVNTDFIADLVAVQSEEVAGTNVLEALTALTVAIEEKAPGLHPHAISNVFGSTPGKLVSVGPAPLFQLVEIDNPNPGGNSQGVAFSAQLPVGSVFYRSDLGRTFIKRTDVDGLENAVWVDEAPQSLNEKGINIPADVGVGAYLVGDGADAGYLFPRAAVITDLAVAGSGSMTGTVRFKARFGGQTDDIVELALADQKSAATSGMLGIIPAGSIVSIFLEQFSATIPDISLRMTFRDAEQ